MALICEHLFKVNIGAWPGTVWDTNAAVS